jgi:hypothetical protein
MPSKSTVTIHGNPWQRSHIEDDITYCRTLNWTRTKWKPRVALVDRKSGSSTPYSGRPYDARHFQVIEGGWSHDHCEICWWTLRDSEDEEEGIGYTDGAGDWLCIECFRKFIENEDGA